MGHPLAQMAWHLKSDVLPLRGVWGPWEMGPPTLDQVHLDCSVACGRLRPSCSFPSEFPLVATLLWATLLLCRWGN